MSKKYHNLLASLKETGKGTMKCFGNSMLPILSNPSVNEYEVSPTYAVGDIVFCKVKGRFIDAHLITKIGPDGRYMISNNHGYENGWTRTIYAKVVKSFDKTGQENKLKIRKLEKDED